MNKVKEPVATYYSRPQISALKKKLKASIDSENNLEVLLKCESLISSLTTQKYDETYFTKMENEMHIMKGDSMPCCYSDEELDKFIRESERSGWVDDNEIKAFEERWMSVS